MQKASTKTSPKPGGEAFRKGNEPAKISAQRVRVGVLGIDPKLEAPACPSLPKTGVNAKSLTLKEGGTGMG
jgi:hypothetical protein